MKLNVSKFLAGGLLAVALPLLSACYATVGTDGRTYLQPMGFGGYSYGYGSGYGTAYGPSYSYGLGSYRTVQGYSYYTPTQIGTTVTTIPATTAYTSYPIVSRKIVGVSDACLVKPKPKKTKSCSK